MTTKSKIGKWVKLGITKEDRDKIYEKIRSKAKYELKKRHKKEYKKIVKELIKEELNYYGELIK